MIAFLLIFAGIGWAAYRKRWPSRKIHVSEEVKEESDKKHPEPKHDGHHGGSHDDHHGSSTLGFIVRIVAGIAGLLFVVWLFAGGGFTILLAFLIGEPHPFQAASAHPAGIIPATIRSDPSGGCGQDPVDVSVLGGTAASARVDVSHQCRAFIFPSQRTATFQIHCTTMDRQEAVWDDTKGTEKNPCWNQRQLWFTNGAPMSVHIEFRPLL
jgi:hypothetical protein